MIALTWFEIKAYLSVPVAIFWTLAYPFLMLIIMLAFFDDGSDRMMGLNGYRFGLITGMLSLTVASTAIFGFAQAVSEMKSNRSLLIYATLPFEKYKSVLAIILSRVLIISVFAVIYVPLAFLYADPDVSLTVTRLVMLLITAVVFSALCYSFSLPAIYVTTKTSTIIAIANIVNIYAIITSDAFFPVEILPNWVKPLIYTSPFYYLTEAIRLPFRDGFQEYAIMIVLASVVSYFLLRMFSGNRLFAR